jgi:hypothetical protein
VFRRVDLSALLDAKPEVLLLLRFLVPFLAGIYAIIEI